MDWKVVLSLLSFVLGDILGLDLKFFSAYVKISHINIVFFFINIMKIFKVFSEKSNFNFLYFKS